jgi:hypothetical protein
MRNPNRLSGARTLLADGVPALMLGGSAAFLTIATPAARLSSLVDGTGLPAVLPSAAPPLGRFAVFTLAGLAGVSAALIAFLLLRLVGRVSPGRLKRRSVTPRPGETRAEPAPAATPDSPPRLRRADAHADAPARRPIFAKADLGPSFDAAPAEVAEVPRPMPPAPDEPIAPAPAAVDQPPMVPAAPQPAPDNLQPQAGGSVAELMARLEAGMKAEAPSRISQGGEGRLTDALDTLAAISARRR